MSCALTRDSAVRALHKLPPEIKVIARIRGGIGNQLFCYAAARRLSLQGGAELVLDHISGFARDHKYRRKYMLGNFNIPTRCATASERLEPYERGRRGLLKLASKCLPFRYRPYIVQSGQDYDERLVKFVLRRTIYLDGLWQSEQYFADIEPVIRSDLQITGAKSAEAECYERMIAEAGERAVAVHVRWFEADLNGQGNIGIDYYRAALGRIRQLIEAPQFFVFSDDAAGAKKKLGPLADDITFVRVAGAPSAIEDLRLMTSCRGFIIANSTFSWWGAWLSAHPAKIVLAPRLTAEGPWSIKGLLPRGWLQM